MSDNISAITSAFDDNEKQNNNLGATAALMFDDENDPDANTTNAVKEEVKKTRRQEIEDRKEQKRLRDEAEFTFKPAIPVRRSSANGAVSSTENSPSKENRFDKLYSDALKRHINLHLKEEAVVQSLTFAPKISERAHGSSRSASRERLGITGSSRPSSRASSRERGGGGGSENGDASQASHRLGRSSSRNSLGAESDTPSFKPTLFTNKRSSSSGRQQESKDIVDRLYEHSKIAKERLEQKRTEREQRELEDCTFAPKLVPTKRSPSTERKLEVTERMSRYEEFRKKKLEEAAREKLERESEDLTFKPTINPKSRRSQSPAGSAGKSEQSLLERLTSPIGYSRPTVEAEMYSELTFKPKIATSKRAPSPNSQRAAEYANVHERLFVEGLEIMRQKENEVR